jgi:hypothetical protein
MHWLPRAYSVILLAVCLPLGAAAQRGLSTDGDFSGSGFTPRFRPLNPSIRDPFPGKEDLSDDKMIDEMLSRMQRFRVPVDPDTLRRGLPVAAPPQLEHVSRLGADLGLLKRAKPEASMVRQIDVETLPIERLDELFKQQALAAAKVLEDAKALSDDAARITRLKVNTCLCNELKKKGTDISTFFQSNEQLPLLGSQSGFDWLGAWHRLAYSFDLQNDAVLPDRYRPSDRQIGFQPLRRETVSVSTEVLARESTDRPDRCGAIFRPAAQNQFGVACVHGFPVYDPDQARDPVFHLKRFEAEDEKLAWSSLSLAWDSALTDLETEQARVGELLGSVVKASQAAVTESLSALAVHAGALTRRLDDLKAVLGKETERTQQLEQALAESTAALAMLASKASDVRSRLASADRDLQQAESSLNEAQAAFDTAETELGLKTQAVSDLDCASCPADLTRDRRIYELVEAISNVKRRQKEQRDHVHQARLARGSVNQARMAARAELGDTNEKLVAQMQTHLGLIAALAQSRARVELLGGVLNGSTDALRDIDATTEAIRSELSSESAEMTLAINSESCFAIRPQ